MGNRCSALKQDEKNQIKRRAIEAGVVEPASQLALQNALIVAKILRAEFPLEWWVILFSIPWRACLTIYI